MRLQISETRSTASWFIAPKVSTTTWKNVLLLARQPSLLLLFIKLLFWRKTTRERMKLTPFDSDGNWEEKLSWRQYDTSVRLRTNCRQPEILLVVDDKAITTTVVAAWPVGVAATDEPVVVYASPTDQVALRHLELVARYIELCNNGHWATFFSSRNTHNDGSHRCETLWTDVFVTGR